MHLRAYATVAGVLLLLLGVWLLAGRRGRLSRPLFSGDLFVPVDPGTRDILLEDWRWKVGPDAQVVRASLFGDVFTRGPQGRIHWLDTGRGHYVEVAGSEQEWAAADEARLREWFHWDTLRALWARGAQLKPGQVFSWIHSPMIGGAENADNVGLTSLLAHVSVAGRLAQAIKDLPPGTKIDKYDFQMLGPAGATTPGDQDTYEVVINDEQQYSMWLAGQPVPAGWKKAGKSGTKQQCLDYIKEVWTDLRPLSLRKK